MKRRVTVRGIIVKDGKLLCVKLTEYSKKRSEDFWCTPGGGIDDRESLHDALKREMIEETGIAPEIGSLLYIQQFPDGDNEVMDFFFHVTNANDYEKIDLSSTTHGELEIAELDFVDPRTHHILPKFLTETDIVSDIANNSPTKIFSYL